MSGDGREDQRRIGLAAATALVVANMIGAGVFTTSGFSLAALGTPELVLWAWAIGGVVALLGAISYGALARRISESGGEYRFLSVSIHPLVGFLAGWLSLLAGFTAPIALAAAAFQAYFGPWLPDAVAPELIGSAAIVLAGLMHVRGTAAGTTVQTVIVAVKMALLAGLVCYGLASLPVVTAPADPARFSLAPFCVQLMWISLSYSGWNAAVYVGGEVRDPRRNLPRSLVLGTVVVTVFYLLLNAMFVYSAPVDVLQGKKDVAAIAAGAIGGPVLENIVRATIAIALFTSISAMVMAGPRVYARMADDGLFPRWFRAKRDVPVSAIALQIGLAIVVLWMTTLQQLLGYISYTLSLGTAMTVIGLIVLRRREGAERVPIPLYPWVPVAFVIVTLGIGVIMMTEGSKEPMAGLITVAAGVVLYALRRRAPG